MSVFPIAFRNLPTVALMAGYNRFPPEKENCSLMDSIVHRSSSGFMAGATHGTGNLSYSIYQGAMFHRLPSESLAQSAYKVAVFNRPIIWDHLAKMSIKGAAIGFAWAALSHAYETYSSK